MLFKVNKLFMFSITVEARASVEKQGVKVTVSTNNNTIIKVVSNTLIIFKSAYFKLFSV